MTATSNPRVPMTRNEIWISGSWRSSSGMALSTPALSQLLSPVSARVALSRRSSSAARMATRNATSNTDSAETFQRIVHSVMPRPMPPTRATGSDLNRAMTATARPGRMVVAPTSASGTTPVNGALVTNVSVDTPPAMAHTTVCSRRTGTPSSRARSSFSAAARTARPASVPEQEPAEAGEDHRSDAEHEEVVAADGVGPHEPAAAQGRVDVADQGVGAEREADDQTDGAEDLRESDGGDGEHQP